MILVTLGDPYSCNTELLAKVLGSYQPAEPVALIGSQAHWNYQLEKLKIKGPAFSAVHHQIEDGWTPGFYFVDVGIKTKDQDARHITEKERGEIAFQSLEFARNFLTKRGRHTDIKLLTAPIEKKATSLAGLGDNGHTEYLAKIFDCETIMILAGPKLRVALVTTHVALKDVSSKINSELIIKKALLLAETLKKQFHIPSPRIAITGLNPHCGDSGMFGREEIETIQPAVEKLKQTYGDLAEFSGVHPADTVFFRTMEGRFDCVLAMYHDQALGPLKTVHFDTAINVTGGLPILRVSPDHGPAADLFLQGKASPSSFENALKFLDGNTL